MPVSLVGLDPGRGPFSCVKNTGPKKRRRPDTRYKGAAQKTWLTPFGGCHSLLMCHRGEHVTPAIYGVPRMVLIDIAELLAVCAVVALAAYLLTRIAEGYNHRRL